MKTTQRKSALTIIELLVSISTLSIGVLGFQYYLNNATSNSTEEILNLIEKIELSMMKNIIVTTTGELVPANNIYSFDKKVNLYSGADLGINGAELSTLPTVDSYCTASNKGEINFFKNTTDLVLIACTCDKKEKVSTTIKYKSFHLN
jgi:hypothetical protein